MQWTGEVDAGAWVRDRLDASLTDSMHGVVPHGFAAYTRIFHPVMRDRPVGRSWPGLPYAAHAREWNEFQDAQPEIDTERTNWATTAAALGTTMHAGAQWHRLVAPGMVIENEDGARDAAGWRYNAPAEGNLDADLVSAVAEHLAAHTTTPDNGCVALWSGWGNLVGHYGSGRERAFVRLSSDDPDAAQAQHNDMLGRTIHDPFNNAFRKPTWRSGILSDDISKGARLNLPGREHILFRGGVSEFADPEWMLTVPWRDRELETHGFAPSAQSPSLVWPDDHAWVMVTEVDFDSTIVGGSTELIRALVGDARLEAHPIREGTSMTWDSDEVNR